MDKIIGPGNHWNALLDVVQNDSRVTLDSDTCHFFHPLYIITKSGSVCMHVETNQSIRNYVFSGVYSEICTKK